MSLNPDAAPLMRIQNLDKSFGGLHAVDTVSFDVNPGIIKSVIGPNGAGKTTLFNMIAGQLTPSGGRVLFDEKALTGMRPFQVAHQGIMRTFQNLKISSHLSVMDNVLLGYHRKGRAGFLSGMLSLKRSRQEEKEAVQAILPLLEWLGILDLKDTEVGNLSFGNQRSVELARALVSEPAMLLLDEPAAGLNMHETEDLAQRLQVIRDQGKTILIVEHDMSLVMDISDEIVVLNFGQKIAEGTPVDIQKNEEVIRIYLGGDDA
ncbi:ABC transporter ATP-binding protein [Oceanispirochaeta sp.]|jgi:branched-chain amino acid transport system ATP-binding protein|uniref:ABC transporter ATP-binding protein n=1 Tax=Oceanispirochaeta sp. TaxID=2035350 RepID=UPI00261B495E|nr:ABC transporter ATP-binding protein [Oceanispirochaeta sp.]MDA3955707.1 ABC transporter ATP-binding protein [Oceanispirochaeta sp.]